MYTNESKQLECPPTLIFVLGDSRTGTLSLHNYFLLNGIASIHYFVEQAGNSMPLHLNEEENKNKFFNFVESSGYQAYSDYPTRFFYKQLVEHYPEAYFVLTVRKSTDVWVKSMTSFFNKFAIENDLKNLQVEYERINNDIRKTFDSGNYHFLEICIDDQISFNTNKLANFLNLSENVYLPHDNSAISISTEILSKRYHLYPYLKAKIIDSIEKMIAPSKALMSETGWVYLANDTNDFLRLQFGEINWTLDDRHKATNTINKRLRYLKDVNVIYQKFIVPEKSVVYREYLPNIFSSLEMAPLRPALMLEIDNPNIVSYLGSYLIDARSYDLLYFRGDTHTNWIGSWFVYRYIVEKLISRGLSLHQPALNFSDLVPSIATYDGDLFTQISNNIKSEFNNRWGFTTGKDGFEVVTRLELSSDLRNAVRVNVPSKYQEWFTSRETIVYERVDKQGLIAVIFRDSTLDFCVDYLAQHFSRTVFVWHQGQVYIEVIEMEKPDIVLHIMAERFVISYKDFPAIASITANS